MFFEPGDNLDRSSHRPSSGTCSWGSVVVVVALHVRVAAVAAVAHGRHHRRKSGQRRPVGVVDVVDSDVSQVEDVGEAAGREAAADRDVKDQQREATTWSRGRK